MMLSLKLKMTKAITSWGSKLSHYLPKQDRTIVTPRPSTPKLPPNSRIFPIGGQAMITENHLHKSMFYLLIN